MPNARTHDFITIVSAAAAAPVLLSTNLPDIGPANAAAMLGSYLVSGLLFSPDLDLHSTPYRRWRGLRFIWKPYQKMVPHRSWVSHSFVFGPLIRVLYFAAAAALLSLTLMTLLNLLVPIDTTGALLSISRQITVWVQAHPALIAYAIVGFILGGAAHTLADLVVTWVKRHI